MRIVLLLILLSMRAWAVDAGYTATTGNDDSSDANYFIGARVYIPDTAITMTGLYVYSSIPTGTCTLNIALYADSGDTISPGVFLTSCTTGLVGITSSTLQWNGGTFSEELSGGTTYWMAFECDSDNAHFIYNNGVPYSGWTVSGQAFSAFPQSTAPAAGWSSSNYSIYLTYTTGGEGDPVPSPVVNHVLMLGMVDPPLGIKYGTFRRIT